MLSEVQIPKDLAVCPACLEIIVGLAGYKVEVPEAAYSGVAQVSVDAKLVLNEMEINHHCRNGLVVPGQRKP